MNEPDSTSPAGAGAGNRRPARMGTRLLPWLTAALLVGGAWGWQWSAVSPAGPAFGERLNPPPGGTSATPDACSADPSILRIASFNIHGGKGGQDNVLDLDRTAGVIGGYHLIALNEVHGAGLLGGKNQAVELAGRLKMPWLFAPSEIRYGGEYFGNGLLCSRRVTAWSRLPLPTTRHKGLRNMVLAEVDVGGKLVRVLLTHIDRRIDRDRQLRQAFALFLSLREPAIILGDFNAKRDHPLLAELLGREGVVDAAGTVPEGLEPNRIDWIITRGKQISVRDAGVVETPASDHPLVWAELVVKTEP